MFGRNINFEFLLSLLKSDNSSKAKGNYFDTKEWFVCYEYNFYSFGKLVSDQKANIIELYV